MKPILCFIRQKPIYRQPILILPSNKALTPRARSFRKRGILSEVVFWKQVHKHSFYGIDFDRQRVIGNYIVDFYIKALGLVIEIDGPSHEGKEAYDAARIAYLLSLNLEVYIIQNVRVLHDLNNVMNELEDFIIERYG